MDSPRETVRKALSESAEVPSIAFAGGTSSAEPSASTT